MKALEVKELYTLSETLAAPLLESVTYPWEALPKIHDFILELGATLSEEEYEKRGVKFVRYADDIVLLAKSDRAAKRLLETSTKYLEGTLKLKVNQEKSRVVSVRVYARVAELLWGCRYEEENR